jgi:hypothetical protein
MLERFAQNLSGSTDELTVVKYMLLLHMIPVCPERVFTDNWPLMDGSKFTTHHSLS